MTLYPIGKGNVNRFAEPVDKEWSTGRKKAFFIKAEGELANRQMAEKILKVCSDTF